MTETRTPPEPGNPLYERGFSDGVAASQTTITSLRRQIDQLEEKIRSMGGVATRQEPFVGPGPTISAMLTEAKAEVTMLDDLFSLEEWEALSDDMRNRVLQKNGSLLRMRGDAP